MAKDKTNPGTDGTAGEPEKAGEMSKITGPPPGSQERPVAGPTTGNGQGAGQGADEPREATRKPRTNQPTALAQLLQQEETLRRIAASLPKHLTPERWASVLLNVNSGDTNLQRCEPKTILRAALQGAVLGLDFNKTMREAYLIPRSYERAGPDGKPLRDENGRIITFWEATFMPGYAGLRKLVMNGGDVLSVRTALVYESEVEGRNGSFVYQFSPDLQFLHQPSLDPRERGGIALAYSVAKLKTGEYSIEVMTIEDVEKSGHHRSSAYIYRKGQESGPWVTDYDMMVRKTVLKRHCNQLPMSPEAAQAISLDNQHYVSSVDPGGQETGRRAIEQAKRGRGVQTLAERLGEFDDGDDEGLDAGTSVNDTGTVEPI